MTKYRNHLYKDKPILISSFYTYIVVNAITLTEFNSDFPNSYYILYNINKIHFNV